MDEMLKLPIFFSFVIVNDTLKYDKIVLSDFSVYCKYDISQICDGIMYYE